MLSNTPEPAPQDEIANLHYIKWEDKLNHEKSYVSFDAAQGKSLVTNFTYEPKEEEFIHDIRSGDTIFNLGDHGFAVRKQDLMCQSFDKHTVEEKYLPSVKELLGGRVWY
jgi:hypothetical protein